MQNQEQKKGQSVEEVLQRSRLIVQQTKDLVKKSEMFVKNQHDMVQEELKKRGLTEDVIRQFYSRLSPEMKDFLKEHMTNEVANQAKDLISEKEKEKLMSIARFVENDHLQPLDVIVRKNLSQAHMKEISDKKHVKRFHRFI